MKTFTKFSEFHKYLQKDAFVDLMDKHPESKLISECFKIKDINEGRAAWAYYGAAKFYEKHGAAKSAEEACALFKQSAFDCKDEKSKQELLVIIRDMEYWQSWMMRGNPKSTLEDRFDKWPVKPMIGKGANAEMFSYGNMLMHKVITDCPKDGVTSELVGILQSIRIYQERLFPIWNRLTRK